MGKQSPNPIVTSGSFPAAASPDSVLSPLERDPRSPKGWRKRASDGVGLGIVVALERSSSGSASDVPAKIVAKSHLTIHCQRPTSPTSPTQPAPARQRPGREGQKLQQRWTLWYDDEDDEDEAETGPATFFCGSPPPKLPVFDDAADDDSAGAGFLKYCHLCRKKLDGEDIYMYRGEMAFCSTECRSWQIAADEYQEPRSYVSTMPSETTAATTSISDPDQRLFYTGIMAA